jgi:hypothetical protein
MIPAAADAAPLRLISRIPDRAKPVKPSAPAFETLQRVEAGRLPDADSGPAQPPDALTEVPGKAGGGEQPGEPVRRSKLPVIQRMGISSVDAPVARSQPARLSARMVMRRVMAPLDNQPMAAASHSNEASRLEQAVAKRMETSPAVFRSEMPLRQPMNVRQGAGSGLPTSIKAVLQRQSSGLIHAEKYRLEGMPKLESVSRSLAQAPAGSFASPPPMPVAPVLGQRENVPPAPRQVEKAAPVGVAAGAVPVGVLQREVNEAQGQNQTGGVESAKKPAVDLNAVAEAVFPIIKRLLAIESERSGGSFR